MLNRQDLKQMPEPAFFAPFVSAPMRVEPGWIDYNGHLNMAYYNVLFDRAVDEVYELLGCGLAYLKEEKTSRMLGMNMMKLPSFGKPPEWRTAQPP